MGLIAGPTASGKSSVALAVALATKGVVINSDSAQVYADLRVVTARPTPEEEASVPHRLFGYIDGAEACSAARWARDAEAAIDEAHAAERTPILTGGTGLYIRALLDGIAPIPEIDAGIRAEVRSLSPAETRAALIGEDAETAARLAPGDTARISRALEVIRSTGQPIGAWREERVGAIGERITLVPLLLMPPRDWLAARCDARFEAMLDAGAIEEIAALLARSLSPELPIMRAIGVAEIAAMLRGEMSREEAAEAAKAATRRYAKRQYTWFRHQTPPDWPRLTDLPDRGASKVMTARLRG